MKNYHTAVAGIWIDLGFVNFDEVPDHYDLLKGKHAGGSDMSLVFFNEAETGLGHPERSEEAASKKFSMSFDPEKKTVRCYSEKGMPMHFVIALAINRAIYTFQEGLDLVILHSSSVVIAGKATLFIAPSGGGKSTIAAIASGRGMRVVGDDTVIVKREADKFYASRFPVSPALSDRSEIYEVDAAYMLNISAANRVREIAVSRAVSASMREAFNFYSRDLSEDAMARLRKHIFMFLSGFLGTVRMGTMDFDTSGDIFSCLRTA